MRTNPVWAIYSKVDHHASTYALAYFMDLGRRRFSAVPVSYDTMTLSTRVNYKHARFDLQIPMDKLVHGHSDRVL